LNLLSLLLDDHPDIYSGPPVNLFGHRELWKHNASINSDDFFDAHANIFPCPVWGPPSSRNLAYYFLSVPDLRYILRKSSDVSEIAGVLYGPRLLVEQARCVFDVSPTNVFSARASLERGSRTVFLLRDPIDSIARQTKARIRPVFAAIFWFIQAAAALRLRAEFGGGMVTILRYEDLVMAPDKAVADVIKDFGISARGASVARRERTLRLSTDPNLLGGIGNRNWRHDPFDDLVQVFPGSEKDAISHRFLHSLFGLSSSDALGDIAPGIPVTACEVASALDYSIPDKFLRFPVLKEEERLPVNAFEERILSMVELSTQ
jgi:hypothetical protein